MKSKTLTAVTILLTALALLFAALFTYFPQALPVAASSSLPDYTALFDQNGMMTVDIAVDKEAWQEMLDNARDEEYITCDVTVNGNTVYNAGIRPKGNTSLSMVASTDSDRFSFKVKFDEYVKDQSLLGLHKLVLNNTFADATYMKEYLSYDLFDELEVPAPLHAFCTITVNGEVFGTYLALESVEEDFAERSFGSGYGKLYKVEGSMGGAPGGRQDREGDGEGEAKDSRPSFRDKNDSGGSLQYLGEDSGSYSDIFSGAAYKANEEDYQRVIKALRNLNDGTELEACIDVDEVLHYFAVNTFLVNLDSYQSSMKHNYYLYEQDGRLSMIPWDYNLSFGGFQSSGASSAVNFPIDTPVSGIDLSERPMLAKLLEVEEYRERYHEYLGQLADYVTSGKLTSTISRLDTLLTPYVQQDPTAFYTYEQYKSGIKTLKAYSLLRAQSVAGQLAGSVPSTDEGQRENPAALIDASPITMSDMGSQGGGGGKGERQARQTPTLGQSGQNGASPRGVGFGDPSQGSSTASPPGGDEAPDKPPSEGNRPGALPDGIPGEGGAPGMDTALPPDEGGAPDMGTVSPPGEDSAPDMGVASPPGEGGAPDMGTVSPPGEGGTPGMDTALPPDESGAPARAPWEGVRQAGNFSLGGAKDNQRGGPPGDFSGRGPDSASSLSPTDWILIGTSLLALCVALAGALLFRRRKLKRVR